MATLTAEMAAILARVPMIAGDTRPVSEMLVEEARARTRRVWSGYWNAQPPRVTRVEELTLAGPAGPIPIRLYDPEADGDGLVLYLHGGGFVVGDLETHDGIARRLALFAGTRLASVAYRLAPEHPYPAPLDDCVHAASWAAATAPRFAVAGDSAGANLALATALRLRDEGRTGPVAALLFFGCYDRAMRGNSYELFGNGGYGLTKNDVDWYWRQYLGPLSAVPPVYASPLGCDLRGLPPLLVGAAECDPLADDSRRLASALSAIGQPCNYVVWQGLVHGCVGMSRDLNRADRILAETAVWLRSQIRRSENTKSIVREVAQRAASRTPNSGSTQPAS